MIKNLELFKVFYYVATTSSLTKAAEELSITQPAVSQAMKQLETSLNVKLFKRTARGIRLTGEGEMLFAYVSKGYESMELGVKKLHEILDLEDGEITIGGGDYGVKYFLLSQLEQFRSKYPNIRLDIIPMEDEDVKSALNKRKIDIGITTDSCGAERTVKVCDIEYAFFAGTNYTYLKAPMLPLQLLSHLPIITSGINCADRVLLDKILKDNNLNIDPAYELASSEMILQYAANNFGVAFLPKDYARAYVLAGTLIELSLSTELPTMPLYLMTREESDTSKAALALFEELSEC